jgi:hypothetical protein
LSPDLQKIVSVEFLHYGAVTPETKWV